VGRVAADGSRRSTRGEAAATFSSATCMPLASNVHAPRIEDDYAGLANRSLTEGDHSCGRQARGQFLSNLWCQRQRYAWQAIDDHCSGLHQIVGRLVLNVGVHGTHLLHLEPPGTRNVPQLTERQR